MEFAQDENAFLQEFSTAWVKIMNADLYSSQVSPTAQSILSTDSSASDLNNSGKRFSISFLLIIVFGAAALLIFVYGLYHHASVKRGEQFVVPKTEIMTEPLLNN
jgi:hypothetical protein